MNLLCKFLLALLIPSITYASESELVLGPVSGCYNTDDGSATESGWFYKEQRDNSVCMFSILDEGMKLKPVVQLNGELIYLKLITTQSRRGKWTTYERFVNNSKSVTVELLSRLERDTCKQNTESCCGQNYEGRLTVSSRGLSRTYLVEQWQGM